MLVKKCDFSLVGNMGWEHGLGNSSTPKPSLNLVKHVNNPYFSKKVCFLPKFVGSWPEKKRVRVGPRMIPARGLTGQRAGPKTAGFRVSG